MDLSLLAIRPAKGHFMVDPTAQVAFLEDKMALNFN